MPAFTPSHHTSDVASDNYSDGGEEEHRPVLAPSTATEKSPEAPPPESQTMAGLSDELGAEQEEDDVRTRLLESLAAFTYVFAFVIAPFLSLALTVFVTLTPILWFIAIPYFIWFVYDFHTPTRGSRPWLAFRRLHFWEYLAAYFPMKLVKTAELPPDRNYVIGVHPHGIMGFATYVTFCTEGTGFSRLFPGLRRFPVTLPMQFWFPIRREFLELSGTISSDREAIEYVLERPSRGYTVGIVPGGAAESLDSHPDMYALTLKNRKGFVRLAIKHGADLVPLYHFGENKIYEQFPNPQGSRLRRFQMALKRWTGATLPVCRQLMPLRRPITTVVGAPIPVHYNPEPTEEEVDALHGEYCRQLKRLFDTHKAKYGTAEGAELEFV